MNVVRILPLLTVTDLDSAVDSYTAATGMEVIMRFDWIATLAPPGDPARQLSLITPDAPGPTNPAVSVEVTDVDAAYEEVRAAGLSIVHEMTDEPWGVRRFFFADADGNVVNVLMHL